MRSTRSPCDYVLIIEKRNECSNKNFTSRSATSSPSKVVIVFKHYKYLFTERINTTNTGNTKFKKYNRQS